MLQCVLLHFLEFKEISAVEVGGRVHLTTAVVILLYDWLVPDTLFDDADSWNARHSSRRRRDQLDIVEFFLSAKVMSQQRWDVGNLTYNNAFHYISKPGIIHLLRTLI
jgi:hypothetical protein